MRGQPLDQCRRGHSPVWYRRDQGCPLCGLATQIRERHSTFWVQGAPVAPGGIGVALRQNPSGEQS